MKKKKTFARALPQGYRIATQIDAKSPTTGTILSLASLVLAALVAIPLLLPLFRDMERLGSSLVTDGKLFALTFLPGMLLYLVLHELTHGAVYKLFTKEKLTFGISWSCAFCGVPHIYTYRKTALWAVLAPFVLFTALFLPALALSYSIPALYFSLAFIFVVHFSGCVGDLYVAFLLLFRFRDSRTLMNDTGPCMTFFVYDEACLSAPDPATTQFLATQANEQ